MAVPAGLWPGMGFVPHNLQYAIPAIPPSSKYVSTPPYLIATPLIYPSPLIIDPAGAIRDFAEHAASGDRKQMCTVWDLKCLEDWGKDEEHRKVIMEVVKSRLELGWPYNYKALDILSVMPVGEMAGLIDKIRSFAQAPTSMEGAAELKKMAKPILEKAEGEKKKMEEEDAKKKQEAITAMWGGLWANSNNEQAGQTAGLAAAGYYGWQYPYQMVPGVPAQSGVQWQGKPPDGWQPWVMAPVPLANYPIMGWPRP